MSVQKVYLCGRNPTIRLVDDQNENKVYDEERRGNKKKNTSSSQDVVWHLGDGKLFGWKLVRKPIGAAFPFIL